MRSFLIRVPGLRVFVHGTRRLVRLTVAPSMGRWIYANTFLEWLADPSLRRQLPLPYRLFALWCVAQTRLFGSDARFGRRSLLNMATRLTQTFRLRDHVLLDLGDHSVSLDLLDPRMLVVPGELDENAETKVLTWYLKPGDSFIDVGANHGSYSIVASGLVRPGGLVIAVEPQARLADRIRESLVANAAETFQIHQLACGSEERTAVFFVPRGSSGSAGLFREYSATESHWKVEVEVRRFDDAIDWRAFPGNLFIKLDVEGSELEFLKGATTMIRERRPKILFEVNRRSLSAAGVDVRELSSLLMDCGYREYQEVQGGGRDPLEAPMAPRPLEELDDDRNRNVVVLPV